MGSKPIRSVVSTCQTFSHFQISIILSTFWDNRRTKIAYTYHQILRSLVPLFQLNSWNFEKTKFLCKLVWKLQTQNSDLFYQLETVDFEMRGELINIIIALLINIQLQLILNYFGILARPSSINCNDNEIFLYQNGLDHTWAFKHWPKATPLITSPLLRNK